jgi:histidyl-tRNA synthetase
MKTKLNTQPYKGTRDYYPEDMFKRNYLFDIWTATAKEFGYEEYDTPFLEEADLYRAKSGEELANTQLYNFVDKGGREVAIRPEMTPSLARMIAAKGAQIPKPIRWFNIGKFYRYEKPQRGRTREFFQLNIDILGVSSINAEVEIFQFITRVMEKIKAPNDSWALYVNNRYLMDYLFEEILAVKDDMKAKLSRAIDNYTKMDAVAFKEYLFEIGLNEFQVNSVIQFISMDEKGLKKFAGKTKGADQLLELFEKLGALGMKNIVFKPYIMRGIAYYTGTVIELYDVGGSSNPRALFGGGRYDDLLEIFGKEKIPAFGLGWGSVTMMDFMETYKLFPEYRSSTKVFVLFDKESSFASLSVLARTLREKGISVEQQITPLDFKKQLSAASKKGYKYVVFLSDDGALVLKDMDRGIQEILTEFALLAKLK